MLIDKFLKYHSKYHSKCQTFSKCLVACCGFLILGSCMTASAFFTDQETRYADAVAGTVKIELIDTSFEDTDGDGIIGKDDTGVLNFSVSNEGSKSVDVKTVINITSKQELDTDDLQYVLSGDLINEDPVLSEDKKTLTYTSDPIVLNGTIETYDTAEGNVSEQAYYLDVFSADDVFADDVEISYMIYAKQSQNTVNDDWVSVVGGSDDPGTDPDEPETDPDDPVVDGIPIDEAHFPDVEFRLWVARMIDKDLNLLLTDDEIVNFTDLYIYREGINDLTGIEYFYNLEDIRCYNNNLINLDCSKNTNLVHLDCAVNQITEIDVSGCPDLYHLNAGDNQITKIDLSANTKLKELYTHVNPIEEITLPNSGYSYRCKYLGVDPVTDWMTEDGTVLSGSYITGQGQTLVKITQ